MTKMPKVKNGDYWKERFKQLEAAQNQKGADTYAEIEQQYRKALREIEGKISVWYQRLANNNGVSMAEARKMLSKNELKEFKWDVNDYIKYGKENAIDQRWMKELENASAKFHISRLEALKLQTQQSLEVMFGNQLDSVDSAMKRIYLNGYYHTAYELQKGFRIGWDIAGLDQRKIEKVISKPWAADGKNFSERIWGNRQKLISEIHNELTQDIILGRDPQKAIDAIARKMNTSKMNAGRLVMTEEAYFSSAAQKECFNDLDVEEYQIVATLDSHTSEICQNMDGKVFPMKDYEPGVTAPPFHVWCRSCTVPYFKENFGQIGERAARGEDGKTYYVPEDMTYHEWKKAFVNAGDKSGLQRISDEQMDAKIKDLQKKQTELSNWGTYNEIVKDFGSIDNYFGDSVEKKQFMLYQNEIEELLKQRGIPQATINGKSKGAALSMNDAVQANPNYSKDKSYQMNCQRCVQTYEFRRRGFDVEALPKPSKNNIIEWGNECFVDTNGNIPQFKFHQAEKNVKDELSNAPDGARYIIYITWKKRGAHVFMAEKINGIIHYIDPQNGNLDVSHYFALGKKGSFGFLRVDDKALTKDMNVINATMK